MRARRHVPAHARRSQAFRTRDRGKTWMKISPDLARLHPEAPKTLDPVTVKDIDQPMTDRFGAARAVAASVIRGS